MSFTLHIGDCLDPVTGLASLAYKSVDHVITDPPYGVEFGYSDHDDDASTHPAFVASFMQHVLRLPSACALVFSGTAQAFEYPAPKWMCAWIKPGSTGRSRLGGFCEFEPILVYGKPRKRVYHDYTSLPSAANLSTIGIGHPCPKPIGLMEWCVRNFTDPGETILDPFAGSGTTGVAAIRLGRKFIGWEKDEKYHRIAMKRLTAAREQIEMFK